MSEAEKYEQVGRVAEEYSHIKGQLNRVHEKIAQTQLAYQAAAQNFANLRVENGKLAFASAYNVQQLGPGAIDHLLSSSELADVLTEEARLTKELQVIASRLKSLAPHLLS